MEQNIEAALAAGAALGGIKAITDKVGQFAIVPQGYDIHGLEEFANTPDRKRGKVVVGDVDSFVRYFNAHASEDSQIYAKINPPHFTGVLNDHGTEGAGWKDHLVVYACPFSVEWNEWAGSDKKAMKQAEFADFIERNLPDITTPGIDDEGKNLPSGADMLEVSRTLSAKKKINFASGIRLSDGQNELTYEEEISGTAAKGKIKIPEMFLLGISVLEGGQPYKVFARLRYRISDANLVMWYELVRSHKIIEDAVAAVWEQIAVDANRRIYNGSV